MGFVNYTGTTVPEIRMNQDEVRDLVRNVIKGKVPFLDQALALYLNAGVNERFFVRHIQELLENNDLGWRNQIFHEASIALGSQLMEGLFSETDTRPEDIDLIITTSCTGFMIPSVDAYLINRFRMRPDTKRLPITELGCAAGAMAMARANEYLKAFPHHKVLVMAIELPSLTCQTKDFRVANLVSAALFGDGGAAMLMSGEEGPCEIRENQTHFFYDTPELMGFDLDQNGFRIILDKKISELVLTDFVEPVKGFLARQNLDLDDIRHYVFHPGGRRIMDNLKTVLELEEQDIIHSRNVLRQVGNLSSASVIWVLHETLKHAPDGPALMAAFGPGFNAELLTGHFYS